MARKKKGFSTYTIDNGQESTTQAKANLKLGMMKGGSGIVEVHLTQFDYSYLQMISDIASKS